VVLLAQHYLKDLVKEHGKTVRSIAPDAMDALVRYGWPGNVRELRNVIERMVVLSSGDKLTARDLPPALRAPSPPKPGPPQAGHALRDAERQLILDALRRNRDSRTKAAAELGISRRTLHRKLNEFGLRDGMDEQS
jgi:two-component system, NtrC family, response regulator AtoC